MSGAPFGKVYLRVPNEHDLPPGGVTGYAIRLNSCDAPMTPASVTGLKGDFIAAIDKKLWSNNCTESKLENVKSAGYKGAIITGSSRYGNSIKTFPVAFDTYEDPSVFLLLKNYKSLIDFEGPNKNITPKYKLTIAATYDQSVFPRPSQAQVFPGRCPKYPSKENFSVDQLQGDWILDRQFNGRFMDCPRFSFKSASEGTLRIEAEVKPNRRMALTLKTSANVAFHHKTNPARMDWSWDYFPGFVDHVTVVDSKADSHVYLQLCNDFGLFHVQHGLVLIKQQMLNSDQYQEIIAKGRHVLSPNWRISNLPIKSWCENYVQADVEQAKKEEILDVGFTISEVSNFIKKLSN